MSNFEIGNLIGSQNHSGFIDSTDPNDLYKFNVSKAGAFSLSLNGLTANVDVELLNKNGNVLYTSKANGKNPEAINVNDLGAGDYTVRVFQVSGQTNYNLSLTYSENNSSTDPITGLGIKSGYFTVGQSGEVTFDFVNDDSTYQSELAVFSLSGMDKFVPGSLEFTKEAARRALSNSVLGYTVISDPTEGAKFNVSSDKKNYNDGQYLGLKKFAMNPGDTFGLMLVPDGKVQEVFNNPDIAGKKRALFSLEIAKPTKTFPPAAIADVNGTGTAFAIEDRTLDAGTDKDYNDLIFKVAGATGKAVGLDGAIDPKKDWRGTVAGKELLDYLKGNPLVDQPPSEPPDNAGNTLSTARQILLNSEGRTYSGQVGGTDTNDYYRFSLGASNNFNLSLNGLTADVNVQLLDSSGAIIQSSTNSGTAAESISRTLDTGTYYIGISPVKNANSPYNLNVSITSLISGITTTGSEAPIFISDAPISITNSPIITPQSNPTASSLIGMDKFRADSRFTGIDGKGFATVILDSGIDLDHQFFGPDNNFNGIADRIVYNYDFADSDANATDVNGHGSNVSSIVASQDGTYKGMAPGANIINLKVFKDSGAGNTGYTEQALQWVVANAEKYNIASVNMSLGDSQNWSTAGSHYGLGDELAALAAKNVIVVSASGNDFYPKGSQQGVAYPSADPNSISVGAVWDGNYGTRYWSNGAIDFTSGADRIVSFSQRHSTLTTIFAPGALITGAGPNGGTVQMGGTSQAAPHIAGIAVLAQQLAVKELGRRLTPNEFKNLLQSTGITINDGDNEDDNVTNTGLNFKRVNMPTLAEGILALKPKSTINISATDGSASEKYAWETQDPGQFTLTRTGGDSSKAETVYYTVKGTAQNGQDYNLLSGNVTFAAGATNAVIPITVIDDSAYEGTENLILTLTSNSAYNLGSSTSGTVTISDNETSPKSTINLTVTDGSASEKYAWETQDPGQFTMTRTGGDNSKAETVYYSLTGSAKNGEDYSLLSGNVTFAAGATSAIIPINIVDDSTYEGTENLTLILTTNSAYNLGSSTSGTVAIADNETPPKSTINLSVTDGSASEKYSWETQDPGQITMTRSGGDNSKAETVYYTLGGTAKNTEDYSQLSGSVTFAAGAISVGIPINIVDDSIYEGTENLILSLMTNSAYNLGSSTSGIVTITDNDLTPNIVTNTKDSGVGSLRAAIEFANQNPGKDTIQFNIPKSDPGYNSITGTFTIRPTSGATSTTYTTLYALPEITSPVVIDGTSQPGFTGKPIIELDGSNDQAPNVTGLLISAGNSTVRGLAINRFSSQGIVLRNNGGNLIEGNFIGTDVTGTIAKGNKVNGLYIDNSPNNTIGGTTPEKRNVISGNDYGGIVIYNSNATGNRVLGNFIGTDITGTIDLGNSNFGISIFSSSNNIIGGTELGAGNTIAFNKFSGGVIVNYGSKNAILSNAIFSNARLGLDLDSLAVNFSQNNGVTQNDFGDSDTGPNNLQNFPVLTSASSNSNSTTVKGTLNSAPNSTFRVEFFASNALDPSGYGEGEKFVGFQNVTTDSIGNANFTVDLPTSLTTGKFITATATDSNNNTSEFSQGIAVTLPKSTINLSVTDASASEKYSWETQDPGQITLTRTGGDNSKAETIYYALSGTAQNGQDYNQLFGNVTFAAGSDKATIAISPIDDTAVEGNESVVVTLLTVTSTGYNIGSSSSGTLAIADNDLQAQPTSMIGVTWTGDVVSINKTTGATTGIGYSGFSQLNSFARDSQGNLFTIPDSSTTTGLLIKINPNTGTGSVFSTFNNNFGQVKASVRDLAFSPSGVLFGIHNETGPGYVGPDSLFKLDINAGIATVIGSTGLSSVQSLAFSPNGTLYSWDGSLGLITINPLTGMVTDVNSSVSGNYNLQDITFASDGNLYGTGQGLYKIDVMTGLATLISSSSYDVRGLEFV
ncbi:Calx-beta domain-containing protein [Floridanema evergladense]|uniref:Calx-beta domain-containing protein n=1 Tax=Floridaenema evergladense BLCC-F167 TaxID=3153639 RepID=A0ABV4WNC2_9CYAN